MSALGSSVINKSGKKFAPKAPARRAPAPSSAQSSTRPSVDRQVHSQTPQPQSLQQHVASSPTPSAPLLKAASTQQYPTSVTAKETLSDAATPVVAIPSRETPTSKYASHAPTVHQERLCSPLQPSRLHTPVGQPVVDADHAPKPPASVTTSNEVGHKRTATSEGPVLSLTGLQKGSFADVGSTDDPEPAVKRRRIEHRPEHDGADESRSPIARANVPIASTETNETVAEPSDDDSTLAISKSVEIITQPRLSAQARRKRQITDAAAEVVADATKRSSASAKRSKKSAKGKGVREDKSATAGTAAEASQGLPNPAEERIAPANANEKYNRRRIRPSIEDAAAEVVEDAVRGLSKRSLVRNRRRKHASTPEGAETIQITPSEVRMMDLCRDGGIGRKSEMAKELEELQRAEFIRKKQRQLREVMGEAEAENQGTPLESTEVRQKPLALQRQGEENIAHNVPNTIIVNGQIQIDETSLEIDRHAAAALERDAEQLDAVEETDMTRKINSATWLKRDKSGGWNEMLTERFYDGLRMFGTDFEMISKMFPGRTRHKIKLKFCKEEKINSDRIKATLLGEKLAVDLPELEKMAGTEFDDPEELEKDLEEDRIRLEEETAAEKQAMDEANRDRQLQIAAEQAAAENESSAKENRRGKGKKRKAPKHRKGEKGGKSTSSKSKKNNQSRTTVSGGGGDVLGELAEALK